MKTFILSLFAFVVFFCTSFAQTQIKSEFSQLLKYSQKFGLEVNEDSYVLTVEFDEKELKFKSKDEKPMSVRTVTKMTDKYVIAKDDSDNYCFYDVKRKVIFNIDYFMSRYIIIALGQGYSENKQTLQKMMDMLKEGKTQKDVVQHLIDQVEKDF
jgi:hypothetical protein